MTTGKRVAVVTGGNRGIGLEICRQLTGRGLRVVLTSRDGERGERARDDLAGDGGDVESFPLDVTSRGDIAALAGHLRSAHGGLDVLVNNAGVAFDGFDEEIARATIATNVLAPLNLIDALLPLMRAGGRIVNLSSGMGDRSALSGELADRFGDDAMTRDQLTALMDRFVADVAGGRHGEAGWPSSAYRVSKIGVTKLTAIVARELERDGNPRGILVNAACPGWVRTGMGGRHAPRSAAEGADTPVWLALLPDGGPQGGFFRDRQPASW